MTRGDTIRVRRIYPRQVVWITAVIDKVGPQGEVWVKLKGFEGTILVHNTLGGGYRW